MTITIVISAMLGLGTGIGLWLILTSFGRQAHDRPPRQPHRTRMRTDRRQLQRALAALAAALAAGVLTGWVTGGILAGLAAWTLPRLLGRDREHDRKMARIEAIAAWTEMLRDTLASAAGLEQAITATAPIAPTAIRVEITALARRLDAGHRLGPSLRIVAEDLADPTADLVISALILASEQRARRLGDLLGTLAQTAREQAAMRLRIQAARARTRTSVRVIVVTTLAFAAGLLILNRGYLAAYDTAVGQSVLLLVGVLFAAAFWWLTRLTRPVTPQRFLAVSADGDGKVSS